MQNSFSKNNHLLQSMKWVDSRTEIHQSLLSQFYLLVEFFTVKIVGISCWWISPQKSFCFSGLAWMMGLKPLDPWSSNSNLIKITMKQNYCTLIWIFFPKIFSNKTYFYNKMISLFIPSHHFGCVYNCKISIDCVILAFRCFFYTKLLTIKCNDKY